MTDQKKSGNLIDLPFTKDSVLKVLQWGALPQNRPFSHQEIAIWCDKFWRRFMDVDAPSEIERLLPILADVDAQWDLYLANTFSSKELQTMSFDEVCLPVEWFNEWLSQVQSCP